MPGDLSAIASSFAEVLATNAQARDAMASAMRPENDTSVAGVINQYVSGASIDASEVPAILPLIREALSAMGATGEPGAVGSIMTGDEGDEAPPDIAGSVMSVMVGDEGEEEKDEPKP